jgi:hypothetical protein
MMETDQLYDRDQVARILGVSRNMVVALEAAGHLERVRLPVRVVRYRASDVQDLVRKRQAAIPDESGLYSVEIQGDSADYEGVQPTTPGESRSLMQKVIDEGKDIDRMITEDGEVEAQ